MCTAIGWRAKRFYFGRNLDVDASWGEQLVICPRKAPLLFRQAPALKHHYAIIGMARMEDGVPLYFDGMNEKGLCMAGLLFSHSARYQPLQRDKQNIAPFELMSWVLGQCADMGEARRLLEKTSVWEEAFSPALPPAPMHWFLADASGAIAAEPLAEGLRLFENDVMVLTNEPPFPGQMAHLSRYLHLTAQPAEDRFAPGLRLASISEGSGAVGLPGDLSAPSRFVRAAFALHNSAVPQTEDLCTEQFFHILDTVAQTKGCVRLADGGLEHTLYTSCCDPLAGTYCYTTYENRRICAVSLRCTDPEGAVPVCFPLKRTPDICQEA